MTLIALAILVPVLAAGGLALTAPVERRAPAAVVAVGAAVATLTLLAVALGQLTGGRTIGWWGGWTPRGGGALGIDVAVDGLGGGLAAFVALLAIPAFLLAARILRASLQLFFAVGLLFVAGMIAFCVTGDIFNLFVAFELMSVAAYVLVGYEVNERAPLEGALTFAITNTVGSVLLLFGIALLYGRAGTLNMAQLGSELHAGGAGSAVLVAFALVACGLLVKAAAVPFHFWTADAYAVAPTPVLILLGGVFSELGLYGLARVWWTVFEPSLGGHAGAIRAILVGFGVLTVLVGGTMALLQQHLKRLLAFIVVSQIGVLLIGIGLLRADALAGTSILAVGDGLAKATLFMAVGALQHRYDLIDAHGLHGLGRRQWPLGVLYGVAALSVAGLPPFGSFVGRSLVEDAALVQPGYAWIPAVLALGGALAGGALLTAGVRVFAGVGRPARAERQADPDSHALADEAASDPQRELSVWLGVVAGLLLAGALGWGLVPGLEHGLAVAAGRFTDTAGYAAAVLGGHARSVATPHVHEPGATAFLYASASVAGALAIAAWTLADGALDRMTRPVDRAARALHALHSGRPGDYVAYLCAGAGAIAALLLLTAR